MSRIVWLHPRPLHPGQGGGDLRVDGLLRCAEGAGHEILVVCPGPVAAPLDRPSKFATFDGPRGPRLALAKVLSRSPLRSPRMLPRERRALSAAIRRFTPELVVVSDVMSSPIARALLPVRVPVVFDTHNIEFQLFESMAVSATSRQERLTMGVDARRVRRRERDLWQVAARVLAVSESDATLIRMFTDTPVSVVPSSVADPGEPAEPRPAPGSIPTVLFIGTLNYQPNRDAVLELLDTVMPKVRTSVDARLRVVGRRPDAALRRRIEAKPWASLVEDAPDLAPLYAEAWCTVLPIRSGAGTKLKVYEALARGCPVVATPQALVGIPVGPEVRMADSSEDLARAATSLLSNAQEVGRRSLVSRHRFAADLSLEAQTAPRLLEAFASLEPRQS